MSVNFSADLRIAGYKPAVFKYSIRGFMRTLNPGNMIDLNVFPERRDGAIVFEECLDRGLIAPDRDGFKVTDAGMAVAASKLRPRTPLVVAQRIFDDFLDRVERVNSDPDSVLRVEQVWLFGSLMREEATVGDIDAALATERKPEFKDHVARKARVERALAARSNVSERRSLPWFGEYWLLNQALFGAKRHPLLAGVVTDTDDLCAIAAPCRLVYDRARGGRIKDQVLERHPKSHGRSDDAPAPAECPDFTPAELRPMDGRWLSGYSRYGVVSLHHLFRSWSDDGQALFPKYPDGLRVVGSADVRFLSGWKPKSLKKRFLDARDAISIFNVTDFGGMSVVLCREISFEPGVCVIHSRFDDAELRRARKRIDPSAVGEIASAAALIIAVDAERVLRRLAEANADAAVCVSIEGGDGVEAIEAVKAEVIKRLVGRAVRIEPLDWTGRQVCIVDH